MSRFLASFDRKRLNPQGIIIGVDEAGRGALAGPVVAGAVLLMADFYQDASALEILGDADDSKKLTPARRDTLFSAINSLASEGRLYFSWGIADVREIAKHNILGATKIAMLRAVESVMEMTPFPVALKPRHADSLFECTPIERRSHLMVDGRPLKGFAYEHEAIVQGDGQSLSISLASIVAKVTRDRMMEEMDSEFPQYGFAGHKGYGVQMHRDAVLEHGACSEHRELFLRKILEHSSDDFESNQQEIGF